MKILFYGASVTAQAKGNGYVEYLSSIDKLNALGIMVSSVSFAGSNFNLAGLAFINDVIEKKPDICFLEWATRPGLDQAKIAIANDILISNKIVPIWLVLPLYEESDDYLNRLRNIYEACKLSKTRILYVKDKIINYYSIKATLLRDNVHTKTEGARQYGNVIADFIVLLVTDKKIEPNSLPNAEPILGPNIYSFPKLTVNRSLTFYLENLERGKVTKLIIQLIVGPATPLLTVNICSGCGTHSDIHIIDPSDEWSFYERRYVIPLATWVAKFEKYEILISLSDKPALSDKMMREKATLALQKKTAALEVTKTVVTRGRISSIEIN
jgi:hypothetical protein